jgi:hypothetical protein
LHYTVVPPRDWQLAAPPAAFDEALAGLLDLFAFSDNLPGQLRRLLIRPAGPDARVLRAATQRQWALSALFELRAYGADGEAMDALWRGILGEAGFTAGLPEEWALDSFYVYDSTYRFNYVIGAAWAAREISRLEPCNLHTAAARIRELGAAGYRAHWRVVLGIDDSLPDLAPLVAWVKNG